LGTVEILPQTKMMAEPFEQDENTLNVWQSAGE